MIRVNMLKSRETMIKRKKNMKRTYIILVLSLMAIAVCKAQNNDSRWSLVPKIGLNLTNHSQFKAQIGFLGGADINYQLTPDWTLTTGATYAFHQMGYQSGTIPMPDARNDDAHIQVGRLEVPLMVGYRLVDHLSLKAGLRAAIRLHSDMTDVYQETVNYDLRVIYQSDNSLETDALCLTLPIALTYETGAWVFDLSYAFGLNKVSYTIHQNERSSYITFPHERTFVIAGKPVNVLQLTVGYRLPL